MVDDIIWLIADAGLGTPSVDLFESSASIPLEGAGPFITVVDSPGAGAEGTHNMTMLPAYVRPSALIIVRADSITVAKARARAIYELLFPIRNRMVNGTWWRNVTFIQEPYYLGKDANNREQSGFNISAVKRYSPATSGL